MTTAMESLGRVFRPNRLMLASRITFVLWLAGWLVFGVLVLAHATSELLSGVGAIICSLFAAGFGLRVLASRMLFRELAAPVPVDELIASRTRSNARPRRVR